MWSRLVTVAVLWFLAAGIAGPSGRLPAAADEAIRNVSAAELEAHITVLASDELSGRGVGHDGNRAAERYIAGVLKDAGVTPATPGYVQAVQVYEPRLGPAAHLTIAGADRQVDLDPGADFLPLPVSSDATATGPLVFAGHGISAPRLGHDDYADIAARGAVVLALDDAPEALIRAADTTSDAAGIATVERKADDARAHGAAGLIVIRRYPGNAREVWPEHASVRAATYRLYGAMRDAPLAVAAISERSAGPIRRALEQQQRLSATLNPGVIARPVVIDNVLSIVEGRSATADMVVVGAHLDHDGIGEAGEVYNGADDNASGTAAVLAMAAAFARAAAAGARPARAVVFALWNGEEKGSLGAEFYAGHPLPARAIVANVNLDMVGRDEDIPDPADPRFRGFGKTAAADNTNVVHLLGYSYSRDLARLAEIANESIRLTIKQDYDRGSQNLVQRSDNWPFLQRRLPAVFLTTGLHPDYHTPDDDTGRIDFAKLERITELASRMTWLAADGEPPKFTGQ